MRSVVINQIHVHDLAILETKHDAPVAGDAHTPFPGPIPFQGMQSEAGCICATGMRCLLQPEQDSPNPRDQVRGQSRWIVSFVQRSQSLVSDLHRLNVPIVTRHATRCNMSQYTCSLVLLGGHDRGSRQSTRHSGVAILHTGHAHAKSQPLCLCRYGILQVGPRQPSRRDKLDGSDPHKGGAGYAPNPATTPRPVCRTSGKKGGVASVFPFSSVSARSGRVVAGKRLWYNKVRKMAVEHPPADLCPIPPLIFGARWSGKAWTPALTPERLKSEVLSVRFTRLSPPPSSGQKPTSRSRRLWLRDRSTWEGLSVPSACPRFPRPRRTSL